MNSCFAKLKYNLTNIYNMNVARELGMMILMILMVSWYVLLSYVMVDYVNAINKTETCSHLATTEGNIIKTYGMFRLFVMGFLLFFGILSVLYTIIF